MTLLTVDNNPNTIRNSTSIAQIIPGRLYFTSFVDSAPKNDAKTIYIDIDEQVHYDAFYDDFGPLNLSVLYRFCHYLNTLLKTQRPNKRIFFYTFMHPESRVNAVYLLASYMIIYHNLSAEQAYLRLQSAEPPKFVGFRDASLGSPSYLLHVQHVIQSIEKAVKYKWLDFENFDPEEYEFFERVENGDLNWIIPSKLLSFCGPHEKSYVENGYPYHSPKVYFDFFRRNNVTDIIRLNKKIYDAKRFIEAGFQHHDLFFIDGSTPNDDIVLQFISIIDSAKGAVAVHCKAGLGRTGTLIACWMMKHFRLTAPQCMGWLRVCRPGSVIGPQQQFLIDKQSWCWRLGRDEKVADDTIMAERTIAPITAKLQNETTTVRTINNKAIWNAREAMESETAVNEAGKTQGDRLCEIKANRQHRHYWLRMHNGDEYKQNLVHPTSALSSGFVLPLPTSNTKHSTTTANSQSALSTTHQRQNKNNSQLHQHPEFSSATTPIKQLKLSATPSATTSIQHRHYGNGLTKTTKPTTTTTELLRNLRTTNDQSSSKMEKRQNQLSHHPNDSLSKSNVEEVDSSQIGAAQSNNSSNKIPIYKVSVSSGPRDHTSSNDTTNDNTAAIHAATQINRKHYSSLRFLKPYMPTPGSTFGHQRLTFNGRTISAMYNNNNNSSKGLPDPINCSNIGSSEAGQRRGSYQQRLNIGTTTIASQTPSSATTSFARNLSRQYAKINRTTTEAVATKLVGALQHSNSSGQIHHFVSADHRARSPQQFSSPMEGTLAHQTNCKYELRPRNQLHMPSRFAAADTMLASPKTKTYNHHGQQQKHQQSPSSPNNNNTNINNNNNSGNPFPLSRHHKQSRSSTAMFVSRL